MAPRRPKRRPSWPKTAHKAPCRPKRAPRSPQGAQNSPHRAAKRPPRSFKIASKRGGRTRGERPLAGEKKTCFDAPVTLALPRCAPYFAATPFRRLRRGPRRRRVCPNPLPRPPRSRRESSNVAQAWTPEFLPLAKLEHFGPRFDALGAFGGGTALEQASRDLRQ